MHFKYMIMTKKNNEKKNLKLLQNIFQATKEYFDLTLFLPHIY